MGSGPVTVAVVISGCAGMYISRTCSTDMFGFGSGSRRPSNTNSRSRVETFTDMAVIVCRLTQLLMLLTEFLTQTDGILDTKSANNCDLRPFVKMDRARFRSVGCCALLKSATKARTTGAK